MRTRYKVLIGVAVTVVVLVIAAALSAGPLVKYAVLKYGPEYTGRKIELEKCSMNIFTAKAGLIKFKIYEKDGKNIFFGIDRFDVDLNVLKLFQKRVKIEGLGLENPRISISKTGERYNFVDIIETLQSKSKGEEKPKPKSKDNTEVVVEAFEIKNLNFEYKDSTMTEKFKMKIDSFEMPEMKINKDIALSFYLLSKGNLEVKSRIFLNEKTADIETEKLYLNFKFLKPFITTKLNIAKFLGELSGNSRVKVDLLKKGVLFTGKHTIKNVEVTNSKEEPVFSMNYITLDVKNVSTLEKIFQINSLKIDKPVVNFELYKNGNNLLQLVKEDKNKKEEPKKKDEKFEPKDYQLKEFVLSGAGLNFKDLTKKESFEYKIYNLNLSTGMIAKSIEGVKADISVNLNGDDSVFKSSINIENNRFDSAIADVSVQNLRFDEFTHYIKDFVNISSVKGKYSGNLNIKYKLKDKVPYITVKGISEISNLAVIDKKKSAEIFSFKSVKVDIAEAAIPENRFTINSIDIDKMKIYGYIAKDGNTVQLLLSKEMTKKSENKTAKSSAKKSKENQLFILLKNFNFKNGNIKLSDDTFAKPFNYTIDIPVIKAKNVSSKKDSRNSFYKIEMITNKSGKFSADGNVRIGENFETVSKFRLSNFKFGDFKQISEKYSNFITKDGVLNYEGTVSLKNKEITSENKAKILKIDIGEKKKILPLGISVNFALSIIENGDGEVTLIVPVKGDLKNPKFSYRETIYIALMNILTNIAKAPFAFMSSDDGTDNKELETLNVEILKRELPAESIKKLEKIAAILKKKRLFKFEFIQVIDRETEYQEFVMEKIKEKYYRHKKVAVITTETAITQSALTAEDIAEIKNITDLDAGFVAYVNSKSAAAPEAEKMDIYKKSEYILGKENMNKAFEEMTEARNRFIINKMTTLEVESTRVSVRNATKEETGDITTSHYNVKITSIEN